MFCGADLPVKQACLTGKKRLLDVATGTGDLAIYALKENPELRICGLDFSAEMLALGNRKMIARGLLLFSLFHSAFSKTPGFYGVAAADRIKKPENSCVNFWNYLPVYCGKSRSGFKYITLLKEPNLIHFSVGSSGHFQADNQTIY